MSQAATETAPLADKAVADAVAPNAKAPDYAKPVMVSTFMLGLGFAIAYGSYKWDAADAANADRYASKFDTVRSLDLQWVYLALVALGRTVQVLNFVPSGYKKGLKGNVRSNPFFYETLDDAKTLVTFKEDGALGMYNRGNRSIHHMVENSGGFFATVAAVGYVFPRQVCTAVFAFCGGRILHQRGYFSGYGSHAPGFAASLLSILTVEGLALLAFCKGQGIL